MKTYTKDQFIKCSTWIQNANQELMTFLKANGGVLDKVEVEDRSANLYFVGTYEGEPIEAKIKTYKAKSFSDDLSCKLGNHQYKDKNARTVSMDYRGLSDFKIWFRSILKLKTEDAKNGNIELRPEEWEKVHADWVKDIREIFGPYMNENDLGQWLGLILSEKPTYNTCTGTVKPSLYPLVYDSKIRDFKKDGWRDMPRNITFSKRKRECTLQFMSGYYDSDPHGMLPKIYPNAKLVESRSNGLKCYAQTGSYEEIAEELAKTQERWRAEMDKYAQQCGVPNWYKATSWTENGPCYPAGSEESLKVSKERDRAWEEYKANLIRSFKYQMGNFWSPVHPEKLFEGREVKWDVPYLTEHERTFCDKCVVITVKYKFPKVSGGKCVLQDKELTIKMVKTEYHDDRSPRWEYSYHLPAVYQTMTGKYERFDQAVIQDSEKQMMIKPNRKTYETQNELLSVMVKVRDAIKDLDKYIEYKGFSAIHTNEKKEA